MAERISEIDFLLKTLIGKTQEEAKKLCLSNGFIYAPSKIDGRAIIVTRDYRLDRIYVDVENNFITKAN